MLRHAHRNAAFAAQLFNAFESAPGECFDASARLDARRDGDVGVAVFRGRQVEREHVGQQQCVRHAVGDVELAARYVDAFVGGLEPLGYPGAVIRAFLASRADDLVAVRFTPSVGFSQTPGPDAGAALGGSR